MVLINVGPRYPYKPTISWPLMFIVVLVMAPGSSHCCWCWMIAPTRSILICQCFSWCHQHCSCRLARGDCNSCCWSCCHWLWWHCHCHSLTVLRLFSIKLSLHLLCHCHCLWLSSLLLWLYWHMLWLLVCCCDACCLALLPTKASGIGNSPCIAARQW